MSQGKEPGTFTFLGKTVSGPISKQVARAQDTDYSVLSHISLNEHEE